jgi:DNA-binding transcriptional LysR family regulator
MMPQTPSTLNLELRLLRYAIAVAEELHFTRASQRLHLATPSLSRQIRQLEQTLGYALFERGTRAVTLTPAGAAFVAEARRALMHAQRAVEAGAVASAGGSGVIRVGYTPLLCAAVLPQIRKAFAQSANDMPVLFQSTYSTSQIDQILCGHLDIGLVVLPLAISELRTDCMFRSRLVAAIPEGSDLAKKAAIGADEMTGQSIIWFGRLTNPQLYQDFVGRCQQAGFTPNITHEVSTVMEMLDSVAAGMGIAFVKDTVPSRFRPQGIVFREIAAPEFVLEIGVAYRDEGCSESLLAFLQVLKQLSDSHHNGGLSTLNPISG